MLTREGLLSDERAGVLLSWRHNSGFSVDDSVRFEPEDRKSMEKVARYLLRPPLSLERMNYSDGDDQVVYRHKGRDGRPGEEERIGALEFLARVIAHIPPPRVHLIRYLGHFSNASRGCRRKGKEEPLTSGDSRDHEDDGLTDVQRRAKRREWALVRVPSAVEVVSVTLKHLGEGSHAFGSLQMAPDDGRVGWEGKRKSLSLISLA